MRALRSPSEGRQHRAIAVLRSHTPPTEGQASLSEKATESRIFRMDRGRGTPWAVKSSVRAAGIALAVTCFLFVSSAVAQPPTTPAPTGPTPGTAPKPGTPTTPGAPTAPLESPT